MYFLWGKKMCMENDVLKYVDNTGNKIASAPILFL